MISVHIARFFGSPLFLLLIMEFGFVGSQITYLYYRVDMQRASKYNQLFKALKQYYENVVSSRKEWISDKETINNELIDIKKQIYHARRDTRSIVDFQKKLDQKRSNCRSILLCEHFYSQVNIKKIRVL